jgi:hypothetical protein
MIRRLASRSILVAGMLGLAACDVVLPAGESRPATVAVASGDAQHASVGAALPQPLAVRVVDRQGRPVAKVAVSWRVDQGELGASSTATDASGVARNTWTLPLATGAKHAYAAVGSLPDVAFTATADADTEAPQLTGFAISPGQAQVATGDANIGFAIQAEDAGSGIGFAEVVIVDGNPRYGCAAINAAPAHGTLQQGTWSCDLPFPRGYLAGTYEVAGIVLRDRVGNERNYSVAELRRAGYPTTYTIVGNY